MNPLPRITGALLLVIGMGCASTPPHTPARVRLRDDQTLGEANVRDGDHLIVYPEIVAGRTASRGPHRAGGRR